jgi:putative flippase GtrA
MRIPFLKREHRYYPFKKEFVRKFKRYPHFIMIGLSGFLINIFLTFFFTEFFHLWYLLSYIMAALFSWAFNFYMNSRFTFRGHHTEHNLKRYIFYLQTYSLMGLSSLAFVYILTSIVGLYYLLSILIASAVMSLATFVFNKKVIFKYFD